MSAPYYHADEEFRAITDPFFTTSGYELDSARVTYQGAAPKKKAFTDGLKKFAPLSDKFPRMFFDGYTDDGNRVYPTIELNYTGFRGDIPPAKAEDSLVTKTIKLDAPASQGLTPLAFEGGYYAPRTKWTWYQPDKPDPVTPRFATVRGNFSLAGSLFNIRTPTGAPVSLAVAIKYVKDLPLRTIVADYTVNDIVPNNIWVCSCTVDKDFTI